MHKSRCTEGSVRAVAKGAARFSIPRVLGLRAAPGKRRHAELRTRAHSRLSPEASGTRSAPQAAGRALFQRREGKGRQGKGRKGQGAFPAARRERRSSAGVAAPARAAAPLYGTTVPPSPSALCGCVAVGGGRGRCLSGEKRRRRRHRRERCRPRSRS